MRAALVFALFALAGCGEQWNNPYPGADARANVLYTAFAQRPKHLDPVQSYTEDEQRFIAQVYEPPLQYHYLKRPYALVPLAARALPQARVLEGGRYTEYEIAIRPGIRFQPHPAFVPENFTLGRDRILALRTPYLLPLGSRELTADDYIYQIKRLAHPRLHSPILGLMDDYIVGLDDLARRLKAAAETLGPGEWLDLREHALAGVTRVDRHTFRVRLKGAYPQFLYWLAMPFFAPVPWEADRLQHRPGMRERNFTLDWWPVGTGPYMLVENNPNARMVLARNPNFRGEPYPAEGEPGDAAAGLLRDAGRTMPFIDRVVFTREKESIPYWNKFLQGYYDESGISSDNFDQAVRVGPEGDTAVTPEMQAKGIRLETSVASTIIYLGFNWLDPVVGGAAGGEMAERARKLRQALAIAIDYEEFLSIFANSRGVVAHGPLPPGIFGHREGREGMNPVAFEWRDGRAMRKPVEAAKRLLAEAGYPDGRDAKTGKPLVLYLDTVSRGPGDKARFDWWRRQFARLSIQLEIRDTDWNRYQEKLRKGAQQLFILGWNADYPDPENFLFLLHGGQSRAKGEGENKANYANPDFDRLFERMKNMPNSAERQAIIDRMLAIAQHDVPWIWGYYPLDFGLQHAWLANSKPNTMARNGVKYLRIDAAERAARRAEWNRPLVWPALAAFAALALSALPALRSLRRRERMTAR